MNILEIVWVVALVITTLLSVLGATHEKHGYGPTMSVLAVCVLCYVLGRHHG